MTSPSEVRNMFTYDVFDFVSILFDQFEWQDSDSDDPVVFGDDSFVDFSEASLSQEIGLGVFIGSIFERFDHRNSII
jgi:hypothetical protein